MENADPPMGVVFGLIDFIDPKMGYDFIKNYCIKNQIEIVTDSPEARLILISTIYGLNVLNSNGIEIIGIANQINGMDSEGFEISIVGIPFPFYNEEFSDYVKDFENMYKD